MEADENVQKKIECLISIMKKSGFLNNKKIELAIRKTPRHEFVPLSHKDEAYEDKPITILKNQTISQPSVVSRMTEWLDIKEGQKILEIGTGSGWQTAILAYLVGEGKVYSLERHADLVEFAKKNLDKLKISNVKVILKDGSFGLQEESPFDRIIITAACKKIPDILLEQLSIGGLLIAPVGGYPQSLVLLKKTNHGICEIKNQPGYVFVPFLGKIDDESNPNTKS